jgi:hypothetical protein
MKIVLATVLAIFTLATNSYAEVVTLITPKVDEVLSILGYSHWDYSIENTNKKKIITCQILYYFRDKNGKWAKTSFVVGEVDCSISIPSEFKIGVYQKMNKIYLKILYVTTNENVLEKYKVDLSDLTATFTQVQTDTNGEIVLKAKTKTNHVTNDRETWDKYLALKITLK